MSSPLKLGIIPSTTRTGRFADRVLEWLTPIARAKTSAEIEVVDLRDYPMPFFDEPRSPAWMPPRNEEALRWGKKLDELDGYVFITAEYNHGVPAVLKNGLDYVYKELNRKPATFVGYGTTGAARAVEQLRMILAEQQVATLKQTVHVNYGEFLPMLMSGKTFADFPHLEEGAGKMLDELVWWAKTLRAGRLS